MKKISLVLAALQLIIFSYAQTGKPDLSFGNGGLATYPDFYKDITVQSDGKILALGSGYSVERFNIDGSLDNTFNGSGVTSVDFGFTNQISNSIVVQSDGKILVAGIGSLTTPIAFYTIVARFNANGTLDTGFGDHGKTLLKDISGANYLTVQSDGKIYVADEYFLTRLNTNGIVDSSFASFGRAYIRGEVISTAKPAISNGKILIAGAGYGPTVNSEYVFVVGRYTQSGLRDSSFNGNGLVLTDFGVVNNVTSMLVQPDSKIIVAGSVKTQLAMVRYNADGSLDNSFGSGGKVLTDFNPINASYRIALQPDGKIVAAGGNTLGRFNADGSTDNSFAQTGKITTTVSAAAIAIDKNRIYMLGQISATGGLGAYLLNDAPQNGLYYKYYEGTWTSLPNFNNLTAVKSGNTTNIDVSVRTSGRNDNYAFIWRGYINITTPGAYTFETVSDDGSKVYFNTTYGSDSIALVNNDGVHAPVSATGTVNIPAAGVYPITFTYFEKDGGEAMQVYWTGPGIARQLIPNSAFTSVPTTTPPSDSGLNYKYYEGSWNTLPDFTTLTPVKTGTSANVDISVRTPGRNDNFAFVWEGSINIPTAGNYTFTTVSDDGSKLYFNSTYIPSATATVNNDGLHAPTSVSATVNVPTAGAYPIAITFFEKDGGESMQVYWSGPGIAMQLIPNSAFSKSVPVVTNGLNYKYYEGSFTALPNFNTLTPVKTGNTPNVDISVRTPGHNDNFAFLWEGHIKIETPGVYTFETVSDDGSKLYFNTLYNPAATPTVNNDGVHAPVSATGSVNIASAGVYPIAISFFEKDGGESMQVYWSGPGFSRQLIPNSAFVQSAPANGINYKYYEGTWSALPNFSTLTPVKTGASPNLDLGVRTAGRNDNFALVWEGYLTVPTPGNYTLELVSDDGSKLYFNSFYSPAATALINNDGVHAPTSATANMNLSGTYPIAITYFEKDGGETMQFYWTGPGIFRQLVPNSAFSLANPAISSGLSTNDAGLQLSAITDGLDNSAITKIYPNPFTERFTINFNNNKATDDISVAVYDVSGKQLYNQHAGHLPAGNTSYIVNLKNTLMKDGIYFVAVSKNGVRAETMKLVKKK